LRNSWCSYGEKSATKKQQELHKDREVKIDSMLAIQKLSRSLSHLFFPHICSGCGTDIISDTTFLCGRCINDLPVTNFHLHANNSVEKIFWGRIPLANASSFCYFTKGSLVQRLLHELKYKGNKDLGMQMGKLAGAMLRSSNRFDDIDCLIPLPLFAAKQRIRGYNQASILCKGMSGSMNIPVNENAILRPAATSTQTLKNRIERWENIGGKFLLSDKEALINKHVLLVDDVVTTGATLEACGQELLKVEGLKLSIATFAYTML
jgi:ComF family protein